MGNRVQRILLTPCTLGATLAALLWLAPPAQAAGFRVTDLKTEYRKDPIGIDVAKPRLSWILHGGPNLMQAAYQVTTQSSGGQTWDSGRVASDQSVQIAYEGPIIGAFERVTWRVRVWDQAGKATQSDSAFFEMGPLSKADWGGAQWIGMPPSQAHPVPIPLDVQTMRWIGYPDPGDLSVNAPAGVRALRRQFQGADAAIKRATLVCTADSRAQVWLNGKDKGTCAGTDNLKGLDLGQDVIRGQNVIEVLHSNGGEAGGFIGQIVLEEDAGKIQRFATDGTWQAAKLPDGATAIPGDVAWTKAKVIARHGEGTYWKRLKATIRAPGLVLPPAYLRRTWQLKQKPTWARLSATALGIYEIFINGNRVGDQVLAPGWTDYDRRLQVQTHDVSRYLRKGENVITATLADGWYAGYIAYAGDRNIYGKYPLRLHASLKYRGGDEGTVITDDQWKSSGGPVVATDMLMGEHYDARKEMPGWDRPAFDDSGWQRVDVADLTRNLVAEPGGEVRVFEDRLPQAVTIPKPGIYVFDLGQNMVGWVRLKVRGKAGTTVTIRHAEMLNPDGTLNTEGLRTAKATDSYTLKGGALEVWEPRFTFHGFRYVEVTGYPGKPGRDAIVGRVVHSDIPRTLTFSTDDKLLNQLQSNIDWGQRGNFLSIPTDCPQRDERLGWTGDAQIFVRTACMNRDVAAFFTKWIRDLNDAQTDGAFPDVAPTIPAAGGVDSPAWGDAGVVVPWVVFQCYGDRRILEEAFPHASAWVDRIKRNNPNLLWQNTRGADYGDWLSIKADSDKEVIATAFFAYSAKRVSQIAAAIGKDTQARAYEDLSRQVAGAFAAAYVDTKTGKIRSDTETVYALAIRFGLLSPELTRKAGAQLVANVERLDHHLSTGFVGVSHLLPALSMIGRDDVAYRVLQQQTFPSWLYSVLQGATTMWERWDGWTKDKGFQTPSMNSFNHYSFGSVGEWMYGTITGLNAVEPGWKRIRVAPVPGGDLRKASATLATVHGQLSSSWRITGKRFQLKVEIPANTTAEVVVPGTVVGPSAATGLVGQNEGGHTTFQVGSGAWNFTSTLP